MKQWLTAEPDTLIFRLPREEDGTNLTTVANASTVTQVAVDYQFLILATDGLWDVMGSDEAVRFVQAQLESHSATRETTGESRWQRVAMALMHEALIRGSMDNVGVCVVDLHERTRALWQALKST